MASSYQQFCGVAKALDVLGERWTLLIARDLLLGPRRYSDLHQSLRGITTNLLSTRLKMLTTEGLIEKREPVPPEKGQAYALTEAGRSLEPIVLALGAFGARYMQTPRPGDAFNPRWAMLSLKRRYRGSLASGRLGFYLGDAAFDVAFDGDHIDVWDGQAQDPHATLRGEPQGWFPLLTRSAPLTALIDDGVLQATGSRRTLNAFCKAIGTRVR